MDQGKNTVIPKGVAFEVKKSGIHVIAGKLIETLKGLFTGLGPSAAVVGTLGLTSAVNAGMTQMEYHNKRNEIKNLYRDELAAKLGKPAKKISAKELETFAKGDVTKGVDGNQTIADVMSRDKKERNFGVVLSVVASLAAFGLMSFVTIPVGGVGGLVVQGLAGLVAYNAIRAPLNWIGHKIFKLDRETTHDRIVSLQRDREQGQAISREQVLSVFVSANPQLDRMIVAEYGQRFDDMTLADKQRAVEDISKLAPLGQLTDAINQGKINVTELAFSVEGKVSGVNHTQEVQAEQKGMLGSLVQRLFHPFGHIQEPAVVPVISAQEEAPATSFIQRLGLTKADTSLGHVERLDQNRGDILAQR